MTSTTNLNAGAWLTIETRDYVAAVRDAIESILPDLTLIGPEAGEELRRIVSWPNKEDGGHRFEVAV